MFVTGEDVVTQLRKMKKKVKKKVLCSQLFGGFQGNNNVRVQKASQAVIITGDIILIIEDPLNIGGDRDPPPHPQKTKICSSLVSL